MPLDGTLSYLAVAAAMLWAIVKAARILLSNSVLNNLPGPENHSWIRGNVGRMYDRQGWDFHDELGEKYGPVIKLSGPLGKKILYIFDTKALHHIVVKDQYIHDQAEFLSLSMHATLGPVLIGTVGEHHKKQRKMLNPVFHVSHMRSMTPIFYRISCTLRDTIKKELEGQGGVGETDILTWMHRCALELVGQGGLGYSFDPRMEGQQNEYASALKQFLPSLFSLSLARLVLYKLGPVANLMPKTWQRWAVDHIPSRRVQRMKDLSDTVTRLAHEVLTVKKKALVEGEESVVKQVGEGKDIISLLLKANMFVPEEERIPDEEILGQMSFLVLAATDTTSNSLTQVMQLLAQHPEAQEKLRTEIRIAREEAGGDIPYDKLISLPYIDAVCRETLRLFPPVTVINRESRKDAVIPLSQPVRGIDGNYISELPVAEGTTIIVGIRATNLNKELWGEDAREWKPERWMAPLPKAVEEAHIPGVYANQMTFSGGSRSCIGFKFSQLEMKVVLSILIEAFRFSPSESAEKIQWNLAAVRYPTVGEDSEKPCFPMKVEVI